MNTKIIDLAKRYKELKAANEVASAELKKIDGEWAEVETQLLEAMVEEGVKTINLGGLGRYTMAVTNYLSVNAANKEQFLKYLKESGNGSLIKEDVNSRTLTAFLKGHLEDVIKERRNEGLDEVDARNKALEFFNSKGASYFTKRGVTFKGE